MKLDPNKKYRWKYRSMTNDGRMLRWGYYFTFKPSPGGFFGRQCGLGGSTLRIYDLTIEDIFHSERSTFKRHLVLGDTIVLFHRKRTPWIFTEFRPHGTGE